MSKKFNNTFISENTSEIPSSSRVGAEAACPRDGQPAPSAVRRMYASLSWLFSYAHMFFTRLGKDIYDSLLSRFVLSFPVIPEHIVRLQHDQRMLKMQRTSVPVFKYTVASQDAGTSISSSTLSLVLDTVSRPCN